MVISEFVRETAKQLGDNARFEAELMVMSVMEMDRTRLVLNGKLPVMPQHTYRMNKMIERRKKGEPLQYILGETEFMSLDFFVREGVLIPRSDTEILVETVIDKIGDKKTTVADICTGSGCIGISIAHYKKNTDVELFDISDIALETAEKNIKRNNVSDRVKSYKMDILNEYPKKKYDVVVSNPPYIEKAVIETLQTEVKDYEPRIALDGGDDGLVFYRCITETAHNFLKKGGLLAFEIGYNQGESVRGLMQNDFYDTEVIKDLNDNDRVVIGKLK